MNRILTTEHRLQLLFDLSTATYEGAQAAENNLGWGSNPFPPDSPEHRAWNHGYNRTLEWLAAMELERREREAKRREVARHVAEVQREVSKPAGWFDKLMRLFCWNTAKRETEVTREAQRQNAD